MASGRRLRCGLKTVPASYFFLLPQLACPLCCTCAGFDDVNTITEKSVINKQTVFNKPNSLFNKKPPNFGKAAAICQRKQSRYNQQSKAQESDTYGLPKHPEVKSNRELRNFPN